MVRCVETESGVRTRVGNKFVLSVRESGMDVVRQSQG